MKNKFFLTFGIRYKYESHPSGVKINPDGYIIIHAYSYYDARNLAFSKFGDAWFRVYDVNSFDASYFPAGVIAEIGNEENLNV